MGARAKAERQRSDLAREIDSLGERLDEASGATTAQVELNKKRDAEVNKLRKDVEEANIQQESILGNLKRKQGDAIAEMSEQIDALGKMKSKIEKDKGQIMNEIADARAATDEVMRAQASSDKSNKTMLEALNAINKKVDNANLTLGDFAASKNKIAVENSDLLRIVGDLDNNLNILAKQKSALAARLADELRCEQELAMNLEKDKKLLEAQCKDAATRADEAEVNALKGGRKAMIKMETRIRELESDLDAETRRFGDVTKNLRKSERSIKELTFAADEDRKNHERMQALIDQLQGKVKSYKKQIEEAEEIAALNLAKYRKVAGVLGDAEASADANEQAMAMRKARAKSASLGL